MNIPPIHDRVNPESTLAWVGVRPTASEVKTMAVNDELKMPTPRWLRSILGIPLEAALEKERGETGPAAIRKRLSLASGELHIDTTGDRGTRVIAWVGMENGGSLRDGVIRVVLVDDHNVVRAGLKAVLGGAKDIEVIGEGSTGKDAISLAERLDPDVIVMDLSMGEMDGAEATKELVGKKARAKVLILTMHAEDSYLVPLLEAGASGYLVKSAADRELIDAVRAVAHGDIYMQPSAARALAQRIQRRAEHADERTRFEKLTEREQNVLKFVARGYSAPEIGEKLFISPKTVDTYKQRINEKLGLAHRSDYVDFALKIGLLAD